jgi:hypothetical protein
MSRFYSLFRDLKGFGVALQSTIPKGEAVEKYLTRPIGEVLVNAEKGQIFHPAAERNKSFSMAKIIFSPVTSKVEGEYRKFVFFSQHWAVCGRFGESEPFGFEKCRPNSVNYRGYDYLSLAFPGITGIFTSLYVKIRPRDTTPLYAKISAEEKEGQIIVTAEKVFFNQIPPCLKKD